MFESRFSAGVVKVRRLSVSCFLQLIPMSTVQTSKAALRVILNDLYHAAAGRACDHKAGLKRDAVFWRVKAESWYSVRCVTVRWETPETLKFKNNGWSDISKTIWPLPSVEDHVSEIKIYLHRSEATDEVLEKILQAAEFPKTAIPHPLFENGQLEPWSAWSIKARAHHDKIEAERRAKTTARYVRAT